MNQRLFSIGITHQTAPLSIREKLPQTPAARRAILEALADVASERAVLATCGRWELYALTDDTSPSQWVSAFAAAGNLSPPAIAPYVRTYSGVDCTRHLLRVAAGLESRIIGEPQIRGQVRGAFQFGTEAGSIGPVLSALFRAAIHTGKRVRSETAINSGETSFASQAVDRVQRDGDLSRRAVMVVGSGQIAGQVATQLAARQTGRIHIANRNLDGACRLARRVGGIGSGFRRLSADIARVDALIVCTSSPTYLIDSETLSPGRDRKLTVIDLTVPRNVDPSVGTMPGVRLVHLDELALDRAALETGLPEAERIVKNETDRFLRWQRGRLAAPLIASLLRLTHTNDPVATRRRKRALHRPIMKLKEGLAA